MARIPMRLASAVVLALLVGAGAGLARAATATLDELAGGALAPSAAPRLLGPVDALGRNGWTCAPERAAAARSVHDAELPGAGD